MRDSVKGIKNNNNGFCGGDAVVARCFVLSSPPVMILPEHRGMFPLRRHRRTAVFDFLFLPCFLPSKVPQDVPFTPAVPWKRIGIRKVRPQ